MSRSFTINRDVPVFFNVGEHEMALMLPAGFHLAVVEYLGTDDDEEDLALDDEDDPELDEGVSVHLQGGGESWLPSEAGSFSDVEPDNIDSLVLRSPEEVLVEVRQRYAEFSWLYDEIEELDEELQWRAEDKVMAERDREAEVLWDVEEKEGRFSPEADFSTPGSLTAKATSRAVGLAVATAEVGYAGSVWTGWRHVTAAA